MRHSVRIERASHEVAAEFGLDEAGRRALIGAYHAFLDRAACEMGEARPTRVVDALWHRHILDTRAYAADCATWFGRFIHHRPFDTPPAGLGDCSVSEPPPGLRADCGAPYAPPEKGRRLAALAPADCSDSEVPPDLASCGAPFLPPEDIGRTSRGMLAHPSM